MTGWFSKLHQVKTEPAAVSTENFAILVALGRTAVFGIILLFFVHKKLQITEEKKRTGLTVKAFTAAAAASLASGVAYLFTLSSAAILPANVMFPILTGGGLAFGAIAGRLFFGERISRRIYMGLFIAIAATLLFFE